MKAFVGKRGRKYYKYGPEKAISLPVFSSAVEAYNGIDGISVSPSDIWSAVSHEQLTYIPNIYGVYYYFNFENEIKIRELRYQGYVIPNQLPTASIQRVEAYDKRNKSWVSLWSGNLWNAVVLSFNDERFFSSVRIYLMGSETNLYGSMGVYYVNINGITRELLEATPQDYDFYKDSYSYKGNITSLPRRYYKYGIGNSISCESTITYGTPKMQNGIVSGFSSFNYLSVAKTLEDWGNSEFVLKFKANFSIVGSSYSRGSLIGTLAWDGITKGEVNLGLGYDGKLRVRLPNYTYIEGSAIQSDTWYWVKLLFNKVDETSSTIGIYLSTDGENYEEYGDSVTNPRSIVTSSSIPVIGGGWSYDSYWDGGAIRPFTDGQIDLTQSYIKVDGSVRWIGVYGESTAEDYDFYRDSNEFKLFKSYNRGQILDIYK